MAGKSVPKVKQKLDKKDLTLSLAFLLPAILITVIFVIYPVFDTVGLSFRKWNGMFGAAKQWVGLENYQKIFSDKLFWNAMLNSVYFMIGGFVILMPLSFGLAMLVTAKIKGTGFFRTCYFLPNMLGTTAVALMWTFMLNPNFGIFNTIENIFGLHGTIPDVLTIKTVNVWIVVLVNEWMYAGYNMLIFAAGLVAIPDELNEAAALDGADRMAEDPLYHPSSDEKLLQGILYFVYYRMSESIRYHLGNDKRRPERYQLHTFNHALYTGILL